MQKTTKRQYNEMLEVLPPAAMSHAGELSGFLVGEPTDHKNGAAVYQSYFTDGEQYVAGELMTETELYDMLREPEKLREAINEAKEPTDEKIANELEAVEEHGEDIVEAFANCFGWDYVTKDAIEEAYSGQYDSDKDFARDMADQLGLIDDNNISWPHTCVDWERAASELMYDYCEDGGYYFRNC